ncbi:hypothetical protein GXB85_04575 [Cellulomonas sp. APG4]|uniref:hypothetical protein n=1 Tax=Cellulomonas sp. APG4 TaxID=1538656 RepID=UPI00137A0905|nr:hypothetical protein [Cellulomonas sp. APG4]NCT90229.1 hypothetical protein [Cellulomonas sp. APG4]
MSTGRVIQPCKAGCGQEIQLVVIIPTRLVPGTERKRIPLDLTFDPADGLPPSHAMNFGRTRCRPITPDHPIEDHEVPAITHFATCPARSARTPVSTATEGTP